MSPMCLQEAVSSQMVWGRSFPAGSKAPGCSASSICWIGACTQGRTQRKPVGLKPVTALLPGSPEAGTDLPVDRA